MASSTSRDVLNQRTPSRLVKPHVLVKVTTLPPTNQEPDDTLISMKRPLSARTQCADNVRIQSHLVRCESPPTEVGTPRSRVVVLRKCDDLHIRTGGFQTIEEQSWRPRDLRRSRPSTADSSSLSSSRSS